MTLCLAAVCDSGDSIACVFDEQVTSAETSAEILSKAARVSPHWLMLLAGDDIRHAGTVYDHVKRELLWKLGATLPYVQRAVTQACADVLREDIEFSHLKLLNVSPAEFLRRSDELVADENLRFDLIHAVQNARLGSDFLLAGFDDRAIPHLVTIDNSIQRIENHDRTGCAFVGSGAPMAFHHLMALNFTKDWPAATAVYALCAAKFVAESALIGDKTNVAVLGRNGVLRNIDCSRVREIWESRGRPRIPVGIEELMPSFKQLYPPTPSSDSGQADSGEQSIPQSPTDDQKDRPPSQG